MKKITFTIVLMLCLNFAKAQNWDSVGCNGFWLGCGGGYSYSANCLMVYNGALYVGGRIGSIGNLPINNIAKWNGSSWDSLPGVVPSCDQLEAMTVYNGKLIVGGDGIFRAGLMAIYNIAAWNDTTWSQIGTGISLRSYVRAMAVYNGNLYVAGSFDSAGGKPVNNIAMWNGTSWSPVGKGISGNYSQGAALCVYDNKLYVGGYFTSAGGNSAYDIATWDGSNWAVLPGVSNDTNSINSFIVYNGNLYAGGTFDSIGNIKANNIAKWNGTSWTTVGSGVKGLMVNAFQNYGGNLYVGGTFDTAGGILVNNFAEWDGANWHYAPGFTGVNDYNWESVLGLTVYKGYMFACGAFDTAGGVPTIDIAGSYGGGTGVNELKGESGEVKAYPNPSNGVFTLQANSYQPLANSSIEVYNVMGERVYSNYQITNTSNYQIDLSNQSNGVYLYRLISETGNLVSEGKIVIEK